MIFNSVPALFGCLKSGVKVNDVLAIVANRVKIIGITIWRCEWCSDGGKAAEPKTHRQQKREG